MQNNNKSHSHLCRHLAFASELFLRVFLLTFSFFFFFWWHKGHRQDGRTQANWSFRVISRILCKYAQICHTTSGPTNKTVFFLPDLPSFLTSPRILASFHPRSCMGTVVSFYVKLNFIYSYIIVLMLLSCDCKIQYHLSEQANKFSIVRRCYIQ